MQIMIFNLIKYGIEKIVNKSFFSYLTIVKYEKNLIRDKTFISG